MRTIIALMLAGLTVQAQETKLNEDVVKAVRYVLSATKPEDREKYYKELFARTDLDWPSVKQGLMTGPYYQRPMITEIGLRHSGKHLGIRLRGKDGKERGFSLYVPRDYTAENDARVPVLFYLHHESGASIDAGARKAEIAIRKFDELCDKRNVLFVAPYTGDGAEWWTDGGLELIDWTLRKVKQLYNIDEDRVGLLGPLDAGDAVWSVAQRMPGTWNVIMPLSGDPYAVTAMVQPIYLGTIDRMDVLMGVPGKLRTRFGDKDVHGYLDWLRPHFDKRMRITLVVRTEANSDAHYMDGMREEIFGFLVDDAHKRKPLAEEVDIETDDAKGLRSLWLVADGYDADIKPPRSGFPSTQLVWTPPKRTEPKKRLGFSLEKRDWPIGQVITRTSLGAQRAKINNGDVLLEMDGTPIRKDTDLAALLKDKNWNDEVEVLLAREVTADDLEGAKRQQRQYMQIREAIAKLKAEGKPIPHDTSELLTEEPGSDDGADDDEEDDGESVIEIGGAGKEDKPEAHGKREETSFFVFRRWIQLLRPEDVLIREDFGADWDRNHTDPAGVRIARVIPGSLADRSGFKAGDVIVQVLGEKIGGMKDLREAFADWKFEKQPEGERSVSFDIKRQTHERAWVEESVRVAWDPPTPYRVDAKWNSKDKRLDLSVRFASKCTVYLTDELMEPGKPYHVFVNGVPYQDLIDPASRPKYPRPAPGEGGAGSKLHKMRMDRAKIEAGWTPDFKLAVDDALETRDRSLVMGAKLELDFTKNKAGFERDENFHGEPRKKQAEKLKAAYDAHKAEGGSKG